MAEKLKASRLRHGHVKGGPSRTWSAWSRAKDRCKATNRSYSKDYALRGIRMCQEWEESFDAFLRDMGECPPGMTLDREDVNGNYEKSNCRWVTQQVQAQNQRRNVATPEIVRQMRARHALGESAGSLARAFGMTKTNAWDIVTGRTWSNIDPPPGGFPWNRRPARKAKAVEQEVATA